MSKWSYTEEELNRYFNDPHSRRESGGNGHTPGGAPPRPSKPKGRWRGYFYRRFRDPRKAEAAFVLSLLAGLMLVGTLLLGIFMLTLADDLPSLEQLENPQFQLATVAYTADGKELARYAFQNRSWVNYDEISPHVINALVATEDHRFYGHWGVDLQGLMAVAFEALTTGDVRGASTITQQLARNLYNEQIGFAVSATRKLKEMITAVHLESRYTKREIIEMYLNTVEFGNNAFGIEAASQTFFGKSAAELGPLEGATLVGMLKAITRYNPVRNPELSQGRRNIVLNLMAKHGYLTKEFVAENEATPIETDFNPSEITSSLAPYFAEYVRNWMREWARQHDYDLYASGLVVHTTLDSRLQELAQAAVDAQMTGLQAVVDYEWGRENNYYLGQSTELYTKAKNDQPFEYFWSSKRDLVNSFIRETEHFRSLRRQGLSSDEALGRLRQNTAFIDSLRATKTRLEAGLLSIDPHNGYVKAWVGGRSLADDWYDHVSLAKRQPGSTFKPFVYTAAIDNGYSPYYMLPDSMISYRIPGTGQVWRPGNFGGASGRMMTLRDALANSVNTVTAQVMTQLTNPSQVAFYARRMGIQSDLDEVYALALGTSDVSLLELTAAYATLANGGLYYEPTAITRIEDRFGNVLYEAHPAPEEALSEETAYTVVDMMRGVVNHGTAVRLRGQFELSGYDLAGKTGTTQNNADGWFMMMHPKLVTGSWVGFNDRRIAFRSTFWGQGAHNAMFIVGDYFRRVVRSDELQIGTERFPSAADFDAPETPSDAERPNEQEKDEQGEKGRVGW